MGPKKAKILAAIIISCCFTFISWCGFRINYEAKSDILLAASKTTTKGTQSTVKTTPTTTTTQSTIKNTGNQPNMPIMPLMPVNPAESTITTTSSSVLKRPWESGQDQTKSEQLKTQWETRRNTILSGKSLKIKNSIEKKKDNIHQKAKGKSSKTELKAADK